MAKRRDVEADIVQYFSEAPQDVAATVYRIVRGIAANRGLLQVAAATAKRKPRRVLSPRLEDPASPLSESITSAAGSRG